MSASTGATRARAAWSITSPRATTSIVRYQGGNNAGHTVINEYGEFKLNLLPSGIFRPEKINLLGAGTVVDLKHICGEMDRVRAAGVKITPDNFKISDRAIMVLPFHPMQDALEEDRLGRKTVTAPPSRGISAGLWRQVYEEGPSNGRSSAPGNAARST